MEKSQLKEFCKKYADSQSFQLQTDEKLLNYLLDGLLKNEKEHGFRYCPCRPLTGDKKEDAKKICPCFWHKDEIKKQGHCLCRLFLRK